MCRAPPSVRSRRPSAACPRANPAARRRRGAPRRQRCSDDGVRGQRVPGLSPGGAATAVAAERERQGCQPVWTSRCVIALAQRGKLVCEVELLDPTGGAGGASPAPRLLLTLPGVTCSPRGRSGRTFTGVGFGRPTWPRRRGHSSRSLPTDHVHGRPRPCCPGPAVAASCLAPGCSGAAGGHARGGARAGLADDPALAVTTRGFGSGASRTSRRRRARGSRSSAVDSLASSRPREARRRACGHVRAQACAALSVPLPCVSAALVRRRGRLRLFAHRARRAFRATQPQCRAQSSPLGVACPAPRRAASHAPRPHRSRARATARDLERRSRRLPDAVGAPSRLRRSSGPGPPSRACAGRASGSCRSGCAAGRRGCRRRSGTCTPPGARGSTRSARPRSPSCPA